MRPFTSAFKGVFLSALCLLGGLLWLTWKDSNTSPQASTSGFFIVRPGALMPSFRLKNSDPPDSPWQNFEDIKHKVNLFHFWATWCPACMEELPSLQRLVSKFLPEELQVISVCLDEAPAPPRLLNSLPFRHTVAGDLPRLFQVQGVPATITLGADRRVLAVQWGPLDWANESTENMIKKWLGAS